MTEQSKGNEPSQRVQDAINKAEKLFPCEHQKPKIIRGDCASCNLVVANGLLEKYKENDEQKDSLILASKEEIKSLEQIKRNYLHDNQALQAEVGRLEVQAKEAPTPKTSFLKKRRRWLKVYVTVKT